MPQHWAYDSVFYHIYPLGFCGAPLHNDFMSEPVARLEHIYSWLDHFDYLGVNALYLGPVFESTRHGYDTADYFMVDRRLGSNDTLKRLVATLHERGISVILDGVFHHTGRDFWAFRDIQQRGEQSPYAHWYSGLRFDERSPEGDPFTYDGWNGYTSLVKLNVGHPDVQRHLFDAIQMWVDEFDIDGLRLDAADYIDLDFLRAMSRFAHGLKPDFWLMGEVIHGDYRQWANDATFYKGLWSSLVDVNYFEIAYSLNRQFGDEGLYPHLPLYAFVDNHDVNRAASILRQPEHLYPLYALLFTMPGVPSVYYGSEWGLPGERTDTSDDPLRPHLDLDTMIRNGPHGTLPPAIRKLAQLRHDSAALRYGAYQQLFVAHEQLAFKRALDGDSVIVALNAADQPVPITVQVNEGRELVDVLNGGERYPIHDGHATIDAVPPNWARILTVN
jgi:glycosidase